MGTAGPTPCSAARGAWARRPARSLERSPGQAWWAIKAAARSLPFLATTLLLWGCPDAPDDQPVAVAGADAAVDATVDATVDAAAPDAAAPARDAAAQDADVPPQDAAPREDASASACVTGVTETAPCGVNGRGEHARSCVESEWSDWGACADPDVCADGEDEDRSCGLNDRGAEARACDAGDWGGWDACVDPDQCVDGDDEEQGCGLNGRGVESRACAAGGWGDWGACLDPDECVDTALGTEACAEGGVRGRTCESGGWAAWSACERGYVTAAASAQRPAMLAMPGGSFLMGSPAGAGDSDEHGPDGRQVQVTLSPLWLSATEVTHAQWRSVLGTDPSYFAACGDDCPVETVSWYDAVGYCNALSTAQDLDACYTLRDCRGTLGGGCVGEPACAGDYVCDVDFAGPDCEGYRLPTEAEWEYAARAGTTTTWWTGDDEAALGAAAWYADNSDNRTHPVAQKAANPWGLYDVHGNVWEWTGDGYGATYPAGPLHDPTGPARPGDWRVVRGGSWDYVASFLRSAYRYGGVPGGRWQFLGFRVARSAPLGL